eukprot:jgi/Botrbrau1/8793/Bobra.0330s0024.1
MNKANVNNQDLGNLELQTGFCDEPCQGGAAEDQELSEQSTLRLRRQLAEVLRRRSFPPLPAMPRARQAAEALGHAAFEGNFTEEDRQMQGRSRLQTSHDLLPTTEECWSSSSPSSHCLSPAQTHATDPSAATNRGHPRPDLSNCVALREPYMQQNKPLCGGDGKAGASMHELSAHCVESFQPVATSATYPGQRTYDGVAENGCISSPAQEANSVVGPEYLLEPSVQDTLQSQAHPTVTRSMGPLIVPANTCQPAEPRSTAHGTAVYDRVNNRVSIAPHPSPLWEDNDECLQPSPLPEKLRSRLQQGFEPATSLAPAPVPPKWAPQPQPPAANNSAYESTSTSIVHPLENDTAPTSPRPLEDKLPGSVPPSLPPVRPQSKPPSNSTTHVAGVWENAHVLPEVSSSSPSRTRAEAGAISPCNAPAASHEACFPTIRQAHRVAGTLPDQSPSFSINPAQNLVSKKGKAQQGASRFTSSTVPDSWNDRAPPWHAKENLHVRRNTVGEYPHRNLASGQAAKQAAPMAAGVEKQPALAGVEAHTRSAGVEDPDVPPSEWERAALCSSLHILRKVEEAKRAVFDREAALAQLEGAQEVKERASRALNIPLNAQLYSGLIRLEEETGLTGGAAQQRRVGKQLDAKWVASREGRPRISDLWTPEAFKVRIQPPLQTWPHERPSTSSVAESLLRP